MLNLDFHIIRTLTKSVSMPGNTSKRGWTAQVLILQI